MQNLINTYQQYRSKIKALGYFSSLTSWDMQTEAPPKGISNTAQHLGVLSEMSYRLTTSQEYINTVAELLSRQDELAPALVHELQIVSKSIEHTLKIPMEEQIAFEKLTTEAYPLYVKAKTSGDFALFAPTLTKIVEYSKKVCQYLKTEQLQGYDVLLDMYEPNFPKAKYDEFFDLLRERLVPFVKKVTAKTLQYNDKFAKKTFFVTKQEKFCQYLLDVIGFDKQAGVMKVSEHPFTNGFGKHDVRITTHYYTRLLQSSIFSTIHEGGHALYEQNIGDELVGTFCDGGASLGMHESQSRFFENIVGRSLEFWECHYPVLQRLFPLQFEGVTVHDWYKHINQVANSYVRIEADELTYPLHIMLRYDMEKEFIEGDLAVEQFPSYWNESFCRYFGITPPNDSVGVLQDVHWAYGNVGYFPTYALGSAIASQLYAHMRKDIDVEACLASGNTKALNEWLADKIHRHGSSKYPMDILREAIGEDFDANYYVDYLIDKYSKLYDIQP